MKLYAYLQNFTLPIPNFKKQQFILATRDDLCEEVKLRKPNVGKGIIEEETAYTRLPQYDKEIEL